MANKRKNILILLVLLFLFLMIGIGYSVLTSTLSMNGETRVLKPTFSSDSWSTIIKNVRENNTSHYYIGDTKVVDMGSLGSHTLRIANMSTPTECSSSIFSRTACGFVLEFADIVSTYVMNAKTTNLPWGTNKGGYPASEIKAYIQNSIYKNLPSELQSIIVDTKVVSSHGSEDTSNFTSVDKLYLLSTKEVWREVGTSNIFNRDTSIYSTRQLDYYKSLGVTTSNYSGARKSGMDTYWWLRSARSDEINHFYCVSDVGMWNFHGSYNSIGVSPAFRIG